MPVALRGVQHLLQVGLQDRVDRLEPRPPATGVLPLGAALGRLARPLRARSTDLLVRISITPEIWILGIWAKTSGKE